MANDYTMGEQRDILKELAALTVGGGLHWERRNNSAHRYALWKNNLLVLGPTEQMASEKLSRYLFVTPFDSPTGLQISEDDPNLRAGLLALFDAVEAATANQQPRDPFALGENAFSIPGSEPGKD